MHGCRNNLHRSVCGNDGDDGFKDGRQTIGAPFDVPTVPGTDDPIENPEEAQSLAQAMGYPVVLKAVAGGGGKGMRVVTEDAAFMSAWRDASSEALNAFGDARLFLEKYLDSPRHIEIQILADAHGRVVSLGERECSIQRRHQKVIEEAPSTGGYARTPAKNGRGRRAVGSRGRLRKRRNG